MNAIKHFNKVVTHKTEVFKAACELGIPWRGFMHDWSKFSPTEFFESVKYYQGGASPIDKCKKETGRSDCWAHHKGRNPHHWEYWMDWNKGESYAMKMPFDRCLEFLADWIGAGKAYEGKDWYRQRPLERFISYIGRIHLHDQTRILLFILFKNYAEGSLTKEKIKTLKKKYLCDSLTSIVLFYGSFNPVTKGHIETAKKSAQVVGANFGVFECVANVYPKPGLISYKHRRNMMNWALINYRVNKEDGDPKLECFDYTKHHNDRHVKFYELAEHYSKHYDLVFSIIGDDNLEAMSYYHDDPVQNLDKFFSEHLIMVGMRGYDTLEEAMVKAPKLKPYEKRLIPFGAKNDCSSTKVRAGDMSYVSPAVAKYIKENNLYG